MVALLALVFSLSPIFLSAQATALPQVQASGQGQSALASPQGRRPGEDPAALLGLELAGSFERFGLPLKVYPLRGAEAWQDDVVFEYSGGFSAFWFSGRVWQLRFSADYLGPVHGVSLGDGIDDVVSLLGQPYIHADAAYVFNLPGRGYPVRMRVLLKEGKVQDIYVYRADF